MTKSLFVVLAASGLFATQAIAQDYGNIYIGAGVGQTNLKTSFTPASAPGSLKYDEDTPTAVAFLGYKFSDFIAVEGAFTTTGRASGNPSYEDQFASISADTDMRSFEVAAKGTLPLGKFELFGRIGAIYGDTDYDINYNLADTNGDPVFVNPNKIAASYQDTGLIVGLGAGYNFGRGAIRLQYDYTTLEFGGTDQYNITKSDSAGSPIFTQFAESINLETKNPGRLMLSVSGFF